MPPRPTAWSWWGSPTNTNRHCWASARCVSWWRSPVPIMPASSTITVAPAGSRHGCSGGRSVRRHSCNSFATVSDAIWVSDSRTRAAFAVGATPNTTRPCAARSSTAAASIVVLPAPAGPTTSTNRSDTRHRCGGFGLHDIESTRLHTGGRCRWFELCVHRPADDVFFLGEDVAAGVMTGRRLDPHRPPIRTTPTRARSRQGRDRHTPPSTVSVTACSVLRPLRAVHRRLRASDIADGLQNVEAMPRRPLLRDRRDHVTDRHRLLDLRLVLCRRALMLSVSVSAVTPTVAASASHRERRSPAP